MRVVVEHHRKDAAMQCPECSQANPEDARFCIFCAAPLITEAQPTSESSAQQPAVASRTSEIVAADERGAQQGRNARWLSTRRAQTIAGGMWLIGLGVLFLTNTFWPGVLVLAGLNAFVHEEARGRRTQAIRNLVMLAGMALVFWTGLFWPGVLILLGVIALLSPELRPRTPVR
jgi:hypothetical protein